jgi:UDP-N-acetylmuramate dehydrogenase
VTVERAYERLSAELAGDVRRHEPLAAHTTFRIGGPAALFVACDTVGELTTAVEILEDERVEWTLLGKGSNVLAADAGYPGAVLVLGRQFKNRSVDGPHVRAGAGSVLAVLVQEAFKRGMTGLEFAVGIPGTLGGAVAMNAGSREVWIGNIIETVTMLIPGEGLLAYGGSEVSWDYRRTSLPKEGVIVEASLRLESGDAHQIRRVMEANLRRRRRTQPLGVPNAGSIFVNPEGDSAGRMIEELGLKGHTIGGAAVSEVHANFIVNIGGATAHDVVALIGHIRSAVEDGYGIKLRPEVRFLGSFELA